jgi:hypothetical protein
MGVEVTCSACRLVQPAATACIACAQAAPSAWPAPRVPAARRAPIWRVVAVVLLVALVPLFATGVTFLALIAFHLLRGWLLVAIGGAIAWLAYRSPLRLRPLAPLAGDVRAPLRGVVRAPCPITAERLVDNAGRVLLWRAGSVELEVATVDGERIRVSGVVRIDGPGQPAGAAVGDALRGGVDRRLRVGGHAETVTLRPGDEVELRARVRDEPVAAGYRELAVGRVAHGAPGRPVVLTVTRAVDSAPHV